MGERLLALAFLALGCAFLALTFRISEPNAALYPRIIAGGVLLLSIWLLVGAWRDRPEAAAEHTEEGIDLFHFLEVLGLALVYIGAMALAGYVLATMVFIAVGIYLLGYRRIPVVIPVAVLVTLFVFVVFKTLMYASLPASELDSWLTELIYRYILG